MDQVLLFGIMSYAPKVGFNSSMRQSTVYKRVDRTCMYVDKYSLLLK